MLSSTSVQPRSTSGSPPTRITSAPPSAWGTDPSTGASSTRTGRTRSATSRIAVGPTVDMSIKTAFSSIEPATPSTPKTTSSRAAGSASIVITTSASRAASAGVRAAVAPRAASPSARPGVRFQTRRSWPAPRMRSAIGAPIAPSPRNATRVMPPSPSCPRFMRHRFLRREKSENVIIPPRRPEGVNVRYRSLGRSGLMVSVSASERRDGEPIRSSVTSTARAPRDRSGSPSTPA